jgi:hypothetical protein
MSGRSAYVRKAKTQYKDPKLAGQQLVVPHYAHQQHVVYTPVVQQIPPPLPPQMHPQMMPQMMPQVMPQQIPQQMPQQMSQQMPQQMMPQQMPQYMQQPPQQQQQHQQHQYPPRQESQPFTHQNGFEYVPRPIQRRSSSAMANTPMSVSSWPGSEPSISTPSDRVYHQSQSSSHRTETAAGNYRQVPPPTSAGPSGIERSSFRTFMDSKSEAIRNKLTSTFSGRSSDDGSSDGRRPDSSKQPRGLGGLTYELPATPMVEPLPPRPRTQARTQPGPNVAPPTGHDLGVRGLENVTSVILRWTGGGRSPEPWSKLRKVSRALEWLALQMDWGEWLIDCVCLI